MAQIFPADAVGQNESEQEALDDLRQQLDDTFRVYVNTAFLTSAGDHEGEIDFLVLHPELGMLAIEVKGHGVERGADGHWTRLEGGKPRRLKKDPFKQVFEHTRAISAEMGSRLSRAGVPVASRKNPVPWDTLVYCPFTERPEGPRPLSLAEGHLLDRRHRAELGERVRAIMVANLERLGRTVAPTVVEQLHDRVLMARFRLAPSLAAVMDREAGQTVRLDERQGMVLDSLAENDRFAVVGGAGTGKTILALEAARRLAARTGGRVLYACFNKMLARHAARSFEDAPPPTGEVRARHFHALCQDAASRSGRTAAFQCALERAAAAGPEHERDFWDNRAIEFLFEAIAGGHVAGFDALVFDEAQDMRPHWWTELEALGAHGADTPLLVFFDPDQAIFGHEAAIPPDLFRFRLLENHRNPRALARWVCALTEQPLQPHPGAPAGDEPQLHPWVDRPTTLRILSETVAEMRAEGVDPTRMAILAPHTLRNPASTLHGIPEVAGLPLTTDPAAGDGKLLYATITRFKGLERDVVFLLDIDPEDPLCARRHRYVGASRARRRLHAFCRGPFLPERTDD